MHFDGSSSMSIEMAIHLVEQLALPAFLINKQGQIVAWNAACTELTGVSKETVQTSGQHNQAFFSNEQVNLSTLILEHRNMKLIITSRVIKSRAANALVIMWQLGLIYLFGTKPIF